MNPTRLSSLLPVTALLLNLAGGLSAFADLVNWTGGAAPNLNWSAIGNWNGGLPDAANDLKFYDDATASEANTVNNIMDADATVRSLQYGQSNYLFHTTQFAAGQTLTVSNEPDVFADPSLAVGALITPEESLQVYTTITGAGGTLSISSNNTAMLWVGQGSYTNFTTPRATLDLSGLDTFNCSAGKVYVGVKIGTTAGNPLHINWPSGTLILAKTNTLVAGGGSGGVGIGRSLLVGYSPSNGGTSYMYLGKRNTIYAKSISVGDRKSVATMAFYEGFTNDNPVAVFRSHTGERVADIGVGDDFAETGTGVVNNGTVDFSGGTVDVLANNVIIARGQNVANRDTSATGTLTFDRGTIDVNTLRIGTQLGYTVTTRGGVPHGTVNVNATAQGPAVLKVNDTFTMAEVKVPHNNANNVTALLNIGGGQVNVVSITSVAVTNSTGDTVYRGTSTIVVTNGGLLSASGVVGEPENPISELQMGDARLELAAANDRTNVVVTMLTTLSPTTNTITVASIALQTNYPVQFPLISYSLLNGSYDDLALGSLPTASPSYQGYLSNNIANSSVDLVLTSGPVHVPAPPRISEVRPSGATELAITATNGTPGASCLILTASDPTQPLSTWTPVATGVFDNTGALTVTIPLSPETTAAFFILQVP